MVTCIRKAAIIVLALATSLTFAVPSSAADDPAKSANSAKLLIRNKDYAGAKAVLGSALAANPDVPELVLLAATCDENLGNTAAALKGFNRCIALLDADAGAAPEPVRQQAAAGIKRLDDTDKLVAKYVRVLEDEARLQRRKNERASAVLSRAAQALKDALGDSGPQQTRAGETASGNGRRPAVERLGNTPTKAAKTVVIPVSKFDAEYAKSFPREENLSPGGRAEASSTHPEREEARTALGGFRRMDAWCLQGGKGWFLAEWPAPVGGRYILVINRTGGGDNWHSSTIEVNGREVAKMGPAATGTVMIADLGEVIAIKSIRLTITGVGNPGMAGLEIHKSAR